MHHNTNNENLKVNIIVGGFTIFDFKGKLAVTDFINQLDIADGLKQILIGSGFTLKSLLNVSTSYFAKILGIDEYVAKLVSDAVNKA